MNSLSDPTIHLWLIATAVFLAAGLVKGVVGLGLPTVAVALLVFTMTPAQAAALLIVPSLVTNVWQIRPWRTLGPMLRRLGGMQVGVCAGTGLGAWALGEPAGVWATVSLGVALMAYAAWGLFGTRLSVAVNTERWAGPVIGALTGLVTAATGVFVIPAVPYLQALGLERDELIQAMGISFTVSTVALAVSLFLNGSYTSAAAGQSLFMLLPALAGMSLGQRLRQRMSPTLFRHCFLIGLFLLGAHMVLREWLW
ncbi:MAG: putative rane protein [Rhizobacter sp.]|nr:putative rane protein [Rhizobacter sp.]